MRTTADDWEWCKTSHHPFTQSLLDKSEGLRRKRLEKDFCHPRACRDDLTRMPEFDLANVGKHREHGVVYLCGDFVEVCTLISPCVTGLDNSDTRQVRESTEADRQDRQEKSRKKAAWRAMKAIRRLTNVNRCRYMWTLTLAPPSQENKIFYECIPLELQRDYDAVRGLWKAFLRRFKKELGGPTFRWILVLELHDSKKTSDEKRGTWHLHFTTPDRLEWEDIMHFWTHGHVRFDDFQRGKKGQRKGEVRNPGAYMSKYIGKNFDESNFNKKRYTRSRNTLRPTKISLDSWYNQYFQHDMKIVWVSKREFKTDDGKVFLNSSITYRRASPASG